MIRSTTESISFIESLFGVGKLSRDGRNFDVRCPICAPRDRTKKKLSIRLQDDANHCWTCGWRARTLAPLIKKFFDSESLLRYARTISVGKVFIDDETSVQVERLRLPDGFKLLVNAHRSDKNAVDIFNYLIKDRGLTIDDLWYFKIGYTDVEKRWSRSAIIPSFNSNGELNYFVSRTIDKWHRPKYDGPDDDKLPIIFNEINVDWRSPLVLCEGVLDLVKCGDNAVPLLGSDLNEESLLFNEILMNMTPIVLALDADMWFTKTPRLTKKLVEYDLKVKIVDTRPFGDPGSISKQEFFKARDSALEYDWKRNFLDRLSQVSGISL